MMNILIVDDNKDLATNIQDILQAKGYQASTAFDGAGAIVMCRQTPFDLVLLDYNLPDMDGLQLQKKLAGIVKADYIIITGFASVESASEAVFRKRIVGYETKPLDMDRLLSFIQQIRERRQAEDELRKSQARYQTLYEAITDALFVHDIGEDGCSLGRFTEVNDIACQRYGYARDEFFQMTPKDIEDSALPNNAALALGELAMGRSITFERVHVAKDGKKMPVEIHARKFHLDGKPSVLALVRDIAERKSAEKKRRQMENRFQTIKRLESLGVMAAGIAHDFNNILMVIIGNIEMAMDHVEMAMGHVRQLDQTFVNLKESKKAALRAADLVQKILAYAGKGRFNAASHSLNSIVEETVALLKDSISSKVKLTTHLNGRNMVVEGDDDHLQQITFNLILNACESIDEIKGGYVSVTTGVEICDIACLKQTVAEAWLGYDEPLHEGEYAFIEVTDDGCGMDTDMQKRIFDPFFSTKFQGRGLGLSAMLGMIRAHQGFVRVDSKPGKGTTIRVLLPLKPEVPAATSPETLLEKINGLDAHHGTGLVLVVDDETPVRGLMRQMLEKLGYIVKTAANGVEAISFYHQLTDEINFVLMDLSMPLMDGVETFQELRRLGCDAPVILVSGYSEDQIRREYGSKGFAGFIQKPFRKKDLIDMMTQAINHSTRRLR